MGESILGGLLDFLPECPGCGDALRLRESQMQEPIIFADVDLRSSPLPLFPIAINNPQHLFASFSCIHPPPTHTHTYLLIRSHHQQPLQ